MSKKNVLNIDVSNFGPIEKGNIQTNQLTVIIGPNSSGKSFLTILLYTIFDLGSQIFYHTRRGRMEKKHLIQNYSEDIDKMVESIREGKTEIKISSKIRNEYMKYYLKMIFEDVFNKQLETNLGLTISQLKRNGSKLPLININLKNGQILKLKGVNEGFKIKNIDEIFPIKTDETYNVKIDMKNNYLTLESGNAKYIVPYAEKKDITRDTITEQINEILSNNIITIILNEITYEKTHYPFSFQPPEYGIHYLPAGRSGLLEGQDAIMASALDLMEFRKGAETLVLKGVVIKFLKEFNFLRPPKQENGILYKISDEAQEEILEGKLKVDPGKERGKSSIYLQKNGFRIPFRNLSSSYVEISPLLLFLQYTIKRGDIVFIEEPEAHMHPNNIRYIAKLIVKLLRNNVNIIINTHSEYFLTQLSLCVALDNIKDEKAKAKIQSKYGYSPIDYIKTTEIVVNCICKNIDGFRIQQVGVHEDGIDQELFENIIEKLYEETNDIQYTLAGQIDDSVK